MGGGGVILAFCRHGLNFFVGVALRLGGGLEGLSDLLSPVVGGLRPSWGILVAGLGLSIVGTGANSPLLSWAPAGARGAQWLPILGRAQFLWASAV